EKDRPDAFGVFDYSKPSFDRLLLFVFPENVLTSPLFRIFQRRDDHETAGSLFAVGDRRRVPLDAGGDLVDGFVGVPVLRRSSRLVAALLLFGFDDICLEFETGIVVIVEPRLPCFLSVGFTGERAVGQLADRVLKILFGTVEIIVNASVGASIERG